MVFIILQYVTFSFTMNNNCYSMHTVNESDKGQDNIYHQLQVVFCFMQDCFTYNSIPR